MPEFSLNRLLAGAVLLLGPSLLAATGAHLPHSTLYPRLIRLHHAPRALNNSILAKTGNRLFRSLDEGRTFTYLATVPTHNLEAGSPGVGKDDPDKERCCSTLYELPGKLGRFNAGTLLYSGSFFSHGVPAIEIFTSTDQGVHWQYLSTPMRSGDDHHGLWEPAFSTANDGSLLLFVSDETDPCCSQKLIQTRSVDLLHWEPRRDTVVGPSPAAATPPGAASSPESAASPGTAASPGAAASPGHDRPGMAVISALPGGAYLMSYEVCGPTAHCQVYTRTSADGIDFGPPSSFGTRAVTAAGQYLAHAPLHVFDPVTRQIVLSGQILYEPDGTVSRRNGELLFVNAAPGGRQPWSTMPAPVQVPTAYDNFCPNYSSALLPTSRGLLELASDYDRRHTCTSYFATLPIR